MKNERSSFVALVIVVVIVSLLCAWYFGTRKKENWAQVRTERVRAGDVFVMKDEDRGIVCYYLRNLGGISCLYDPTQDLPQEQTSWNLEY